MWTRSAGATSPPRTSARPSPTWSRWRAPRSYVAGLPVGAGQAGGDPGPHTLARRVPRRQGSGQARPRQGQRQTAVHIALQGAGSVASGVAMHAGRRRREADACRRRPGQGAEACARPFAARSSVPTRSWPSRPTSSAPARWARSSTEQSIAALKVPVVAGGANNQLATEDRRRAHPCARDPLRTRLRDQRRRHHQRLDANISNDGDAHVVRERIEGIPVRLEQIWSESASSGRDPGRRRRQHGPASHRTRLNAAPSFRVMTC